MDYLKIYNKLINRGKSRIKQKRDGLHKHRILPGFEGGKYIEENITLLTRQEHRIVHYMRYKLYNSIEDKWAYLKLHNIMAEAKIIELCSLSGKIQSQHNKQFNIGIFNLDKKELSNYGKMGAAKIKKLQTGIYKLTKEDRQKQQLNGAKKRKQRFVSDVDFMKKIIINAKNNLEKITFEKRSQGGKTQGRRHAESGHCKKIAHLGGLIQGPKNVEFLRELTKKQRKVIIVDNIIFESQTSAGKAYNICAASVKGRVESKHFPNWNYYIKQ